jgi:hypothetical protein
MDKYIINENTMRPMKIAGSTHKSLIRKKLRDKTENEIVLSNIPYLEYKKIKKTLPKINDEQFYYYNKNTNTVIKKNKSIKNEQIIKHILDRLPSIIDTMLNEINEDETKDEIKQKMIKIFYASLI